MKHIFAFIFSVVCTASGWAQTADSSAVKSTRHGLRVGVDLYKVTRAIYDDKYKGLELVGDYRLTRRYYLAAEIGNEQKRTDEDRLDFTTKGSYIKLGVDYNTYENWLDMENIISVGARYGFSTFSQELHSYRIYNPHPYFGPEHQVITNEEFSGLNANWLELVAGLKAEVLPNLYLGFSARINYLISQKVPENFDNLYIPGFHRTYDGNIGVGFNYTVSYFIPLYKTRVKTD